MADGYARSSGRPGVVVVTTGPGATNTMTPLAESYAGSHARASSIMSDIAVDDGRPRRRRAARGPEPDRVLPAGHADGGGADAGGRHPDARSRARSSCCAPDGPGPSRSRFRTTSSPARWRRSSRRADRRPAPAVSRRGHRGRRGATLARRDGRCIVAGGGVVARGRRGRAAGARAAAGRSGDHHRDGARRDRRATIRCGTPCCRTSARPRRSSRPPTSCSPSAAAWRPARRRGSCSISRSRRSRR